MSTQPLMIKAICTRCGRTSLVKIQLPKMKLPLCMVCWHKMELVQSATLIDKLCSPLAWLEASINFFAKKDVETEKD